MKTWVMWPVLLAFVALLVGAALHANPHEAGRRID